METSRFSKDVINRASLRFIKGWRLHLSASSQRAEWEDPSQVKYWTPYTNALHIVQVLREDIDRAETEAGSVYFLSD